MAQTAPRGDVNIVDAAGARRRLTAPASPFSRSSQHQTAALASRACAAPRRASRACLRASVPRGACSGAARRAL